MAIVRTADTDDDGTGTTGRVRDAAWKTEFYGQIDAADTLNASPGICNGRLTLTTVTPVTTADVLAATAVKWTPYQGTRIALFDGAATWNVRTFAELSIAIAGFAASTIFDVFAYDNASVVTLETLAWTNDTTRATALVLQDGVYVKSGATTRRYLGSFRTTTTIGQTEDSAVKRYVWNYANRVKRLLLRNEATASWTYTLATWRQANGAVANQVEVVVGVAEVGLDVAVTAIVDSTNVGTLTAVGIGEDSTTVAVAGSQMQFAGTAVASTWTAVQARLVKYPAIGRHFYAWLEQSTAAGTTTWAGTAGVSYAQPGLAGWIDG